MTESKLLFGKIANMGETQDVAWSKAQRPDDQIECSGVWFPGSTNQYTQKGSSPSFGTFDAVQGRQPHL